MVRKKYIIGVLIPSNRPIYITREYQMGVRLPELCFKDVQYYLTSTPLHASQWIEFNEAENFLMGLIVAGNKIETGINAALFFIEPVYQAQL